MQDEIFQNKAQIFASAERWLDAHAQALHRRMSEAVARISDDEVAQGLWGPDAVESLMERDVLEQRP